MVLSRTLTVRSLVMAAALMTQWLFNFTIAKLTPIVLYHIAYGTFLLFGSCCIAMGNYTIFCVPETKNGSLESVHLLSEGGIVRGGVGDMCRGYVGRGCCRIIMLRMKAAEKVRLRIRMRMRRGAAAWRRGPRRRGRGMLRRHGHRSLGCKKMGIRWDLQRRIM